MMTPAAAPPLILTLALDEPAAAFFNARRQAHFPPARNYLAAHLTLFHHLPGEQQAELEAQLAARCRTLAPLPLRVSEVLFLGQGVASHVESAALEALHRELQAQWWPQLTPQDRQRRRPHVTVQNKVTAPVARALHAQLAAQFVPFDAVGTGLKLWAYRGGPWEERAGWAFGAAR